MIFKICSTDFNAMKQNRTKETFNMKYYPLSEEIIYESSQLDENKQPHSFYMLSGTILGLRTHKKRLEQTLDKEECLEAKRHLSSLREI